MADSITLTLYIVTGIIAALVLYSLLRGTQLFFKSKRPGIKSPKFRGKSILIDEEDFGRAVVEGYEPTSPHSGYVRLVSQNGIVFKQHYNNWEIEPVHPLETMAGDQRPAWRVKGKSYKISDTQSVQHEKDVIELASKLKRKEVEEKVAVNEAATLKDMALDIIREVKEPAKVVDISKAK